MATLTAKPESLSIIKQKVKKAYFAKRVVTGSKASNETYSYTFTGSSNNTKTQEAKKNIAGIIYKKIKPDLDKNNQTTSVDEITKALTKDSYKKPDKVTFALTKDTVRFDGLKEASLGDEVYIYIETENIPAGREIKMNFRQGGDSKVITEVGEGIFVTQEGSNAANKLFTATVGTFSEEKSVANAADFEHFAIAKVKLASSNDDENKKYKEALDKAEGKKTQFYIAMDAEPDGQDWFEVQYEEIVDNRPNVWYYGEGNWLEFGSVKNVINIYHTGEISKLDLKGVEEITYIYYDSNDKQHEICTCKLLEIDERKKGEAHDQETKHTVEPGYDENNIVTYSHASSRKKYTYPDGTIRTYGKYDGDYRRVVYGKGTEKKHIVKLPNGLDKKVNGKSVKFSFESTARRYCGPEHFACFIGALADVGYTDIESGGMCEEDGTCFPSTTHNNGQSVDTDYLDDKREQKFIDAMHKFGFTYQLRGHAKKKFNHTTAKSHHNSHLHSGGLKPKYK